MKMTIGAVIIAGALLAGCAAPTPSPTATPTQSAVAPGAATSLLIRTGRLVFGVCAVAFAEVLSNVSPSSSFRQ